MVDTGSNVTLISQAFVARCLWGQESKKERPYLLQGMSHQYSNITKEIRVAQLQHQDKRCVMDVDVVENLNAECILGLDWLDQTGFLIDPLKRQLIARPQFDFKQYTQGVWARPLHRTPILKQVNRVVKQDDWEQEMKDAIEEPEIPYEYRDYKDVFKHDQTINALPKHQPWDHEIPLMEGKTPTKERIYPLSRAQELELRKYIDENLTKGFIQPSKSPAGYPILFVPKKDGSLRLCVDYRKLNEITIKNSYPLPLISELQDRLQGAKWFTALDLRGAYNLIRIKEGEEWKTAFSTRYGLYEYQVMPFGLTNAPASCQALINEALYEGLDIFVIAYLDDILVFSKNRGEHVKHVRWVMEQLRKKELKLKLSKCEFFKHEVPFLGSIVGEYGVRPDPAKVQSVLEWPEPKTVKEVQSFLGLANYYRRFIKEFSRIATPLTMLTRKDITFYMGPEAKAAFLKLKELFSKAPILVCFDPEKRIVIETDASGFAIAAVISQPDDKGRMRPIAYYSRKMSPAETNYEIHDMELLAIVEAIREWKVYLEGSKYPIDIYSDHLNLTYWTSSKKLGKRQIRWAESMAPYKFKIHHVKGTENARADALSRRPDYAEGKEKMIDFQMFKKEGNALVYAQPKVNMHKKVASLRPQECPNCGDDFDHNNECPGCWTKQVESTTGQQDISYEEKLKILAAHHDNKTAGHFGVEKTTELITRNWTWKGLNKDVKEYIKRCDVCARTKASRHKPYGKLQSLEAPSGAWEEVTMDFVGPLPKSKDPATKQEYDMIYVIMDRLTKYAYFIPTLSTMKAEELAYVFMRNVFASHGMPAKLISDRDKLFKSKFWQSLMDQLGSKQKMSTAFHPQTDGQTERTNQTLEQYLRAYVNYEQDNWVELLPMAQISYNNSKVATRISPFYANYGFHPNVNQEPLNVFPQAQQATIKTDKLKQLHQEMSAEIEFLAERMAKFANRGRSEGPDFKEGGTAYLLRRNIKTKRPSDKLDYKKLGPFKIEKKLGPVTFRLRLPKEMKIHPVFHIALLEHAHQDTPIQQHQEAEAPEEELEYDVEEVLAAKLDKGKPVYLIKWRGYSETENSWEPEDNLTPDTVTAVQQEHPEWFPLTTPKRARRKPIKHWVDHNKKKKPKVVTTQYEDCIGTDDRCLRHDASQDTKCQKYKGQLMNKETKNWLWRHGITTDPVVNGKYTNCGGGERMCAKHHSTDPKCHYYTGNTQIRSDAPRRLEDKA